MHPPWNSTSVQSQWFIGYGRVHMEVAFTHYPACARARRLNLMAYWQCFVEAHRNRNGNAVS